MFLGSIITTCRVFFFSRVATDTCVRAQGLESNIKNALDTACEIGEDGKAAHGGVALTLIITVDHYKFTTITDPDDK